MTSQKPFDLMFENLFHSLKARNEIFEVSSKFWPQEEASLMFKYVWEHEAAHSSIEIASIPKSKCDDLSEYYRKEGNKLYQKKKLTEALKHYNMSIMYAPCFSNKKLGSDGIELNNSKSLSLAYANRSAVFFELENYENCLRDITRSVAEGYPSIPRAKLIERQVKCHIAMGSFHKAESVRQEGILFLKSLNLEEKIFLQLKSNLDSLESKCIGQDNLKNGNKYQNATHKKLNVPTLGSINNAIPSLSSAVSMSYSEEKGRLLIANRDILPGEVLIKEKGFAHVVLPESFKTHCSYCLERTLSPLPCPDCSFVMFCSDECLSKAMAEFHQLECPILPSLVGLDMGKNVFLALRIITKMSLSELKSKISLYESEHQEPSRLGFNDQNQYLSDDYRPIYNLVTNKSKRSVSDLFKRSVMAFTLVKLLLKSSYFGHVQTSDDNSSELTSDILLVGTVLLDHMMNLPCNAHSIVEFRVNSLCPKASDVEEVGAGAFAVLSLTNHSCHPSVSRSCYGATVVAKAILFIPRGAEICDSYGELYVGETKLERQRKLNQQYYFVCSCEACSNNWSTYEHLPDTEYIVCPVCSNSIQLGKNQCTRCNKHISAITVQIGGKKENLFTVTTKLAKAMVSFSDVYNNVLQGHVSEEDVECITKLIYYLCNCCKLPSKQLFEAQETLKRCFDMQSSHYVV